MNALICSIEGCGLVIRTKKSGLCNRHELRLRRHGDPVGGRKPQVPKEWLIQQRIEAIIDRDGPIPEHDRSLGNCWISHGAHDGRGYAAINIRHQIIRLHVAVYICENGPVPAGLYVCHKCDNTGCFRGSHLYAGTPKENTRDMMIRNRAAPQFGHVREWADRRTTT